MATRSRLELRGLKTHAAKALRSSPTRELHHRPVDQPSGPALKVEIRCSTCWASGTTQAQVHAKVPDGFDRTDGSGEALTMDQGSLSRRWWSFREPGPDPKHDDTLPGIPGVRFYVLGPPKDKD